MNKEYRFVKDYKDNDTLRKSLGDLAKKVFGIEMELWYKTGYWQEQYIPYSIVFKENVIANISVNLMRFVEKDRTRNLIQLGTVITEKSYQGKGLSRFLMERVLEDYQGKTEGIYLFANDSVLDFYPKFGFEKSKEYQYSKMVQNQGKQTVTLKHLKSKEELKELEQIIKAHNYIGAFEMDNLGLLMFYASTILNDNVYYMEESDTYIIADVKDDTLVLYSILSKGPVNEASVIRAFGDTIKKVVFEYTPSSTIDCEVKELKEEDTTLFVMGAGLKLFDTESKMFPSISHA